MKKMFRFMVVLMVMMLVLPAATAKGKKGGQSSTSAREKSKGKGKKGGQSSTSAREKKGKNGKDNISEGKNDEGVVVVSIPSHYVRVVYFYPADYTTDQRYLDAVDPFVQDIRSWYREKTGKTFYARSVEVIRGQKNAEEYSIPTAWAPDGAAWANVYAELGIDCNANTSIVTLVFLARTLQHANGRTCAPIGTWYNPVYNGDVTVSEANFDAEIAGACPGVALENYWWDCNQATKRRAVAHELGHAFSLSHPDCSLTVDGRSYCDLTIMWSWWNLDAGFIDEPTAPEMSTLLASPWFH